MRACLAATVLVACSFSTTIPEENSAIDARPIDAKPLPACPSAPASCVQFDCVMNPASCYYYCPNDDTSSVAHNKCTLIATGACLVTVNDATESACILAAAGGTSLVYIGLRQSMMGGEPSGGWGWYCGPPSSYPPPLPWAPGEPNNAGAPISEEDCGASKPTGTWVDVGCNESYRYVCEAPRPTQ